MIGETLGHRYTLVAQIGRGGMGAVYAAEQRDTRERVAVKVLHSLSAAHDAGTSIIAPISGRWDAFCMQPSPGALRSSTSRPSDSS